MSSSYCSKGGKWKNLFHGTGSLHALDIPHVIDVRTPGKMDFTGVSIVRCDAGWC